MTQLAASCPPPRPQDSLAWVALPSLLG